MLEVKYGGLNEATNDLGDVRRIRELFVGFQRYFFEKRESA